MQKELKDKFKFASLTMRMTKRASFPSSAAEHLPLGKIRNKGCLYTDLEANLQNGFHCLTSVLYPVLGKNYSYIEDFYTAGLHVTILHSRSGYPHSPQSYFFKVYRPFKTGLSVAKNDQF